MKTLQIIQFQNVLAFLFNKYFANRCTYLMPINIMVNDKILSTIMNLYIHVCSNILFFIIEKMPNLPG